MDMAENSIVKTKNKVTGRTDHVAFGVRQRRALTLTLSSKGTTNGSSVRMARCRSSDTES